MERELEPDIFSMAAHNPRNNFLFPLQLNKRARRFPHSVDVKQNHKLNIVFSSKL